MCHLLITDDQFNRIVSNEIIRKSKKKITLKKYIKMMAKCEIVSFCLQKEIGCVECASDHTTCVNSMVWFNFKQSNNAIHLKYPKNIIIIIRMRSHWNRRRFHFEQIFSCRLKLETNWYTTNIVYMRRKKTHNKNKDKNPKTTQKKQNKCKEKNHKIDTK